MMILEAIVHFTKLNEETANRIWTILVETCGAAERDRQQFVQSATYQGISEYRFCGKLGFGGKFWADPYRVSCYPEDETEERKEMIEKANAELQIMEREKQIAINNHNHNISVLTKHYKWLLQMVVEEAYREGIDPKKLLFNVLKELKKRVNIAEYTILEENDKRVTVKFDFYESMSAVFKVQLEQTGRIFDWRVDGF